MLQIPTAMSATGLHVLGVSAYFHDASAALATDGQIVAAAAEERFTRIKHDATFPKYAVEYCLRQAGVQPDDLAAVVVYEEPHVKFSRVLVSTLAEFPRGMWRFAEAVIPWLNRRLWTRNEVAFRLSLDPAKVLCVPHHECHAEQAFAACSVPEAAFLVVDAVGEWACTSLGVVRADGRDGVEFLETTDYPDSLGLAYAAFTAFLGFRPNDAEASTMALAAFGEPRYADRVRNVIRLADDGRYRICPGYFDFLATGRGLFLPDLVRDFGEPRPVSRSLRFDALADLGETPADTTDQRYADLAASVQQVFEEALLGLASRARHQTGLRHLCFAGGAALNAVANARLIREAGFDQVFVPTDPGDGGAAVGAALAGSRRRSQPQRRVGLSPYLGASFDPRATVSLATRADPQDWMPYRSGGRPDDRPPRLEVQTFAAERDLLREVAQQLKAGHVIGWFQDRFEFGPRALGNRSILVDPGNLAAVRTLSSEIKSRAAFRPYALSICAEDADQAFDLPVGAPACARWMQTVDVVRPAAQSRLRGALHANRTTRLQVCAAEDNPRFHALLSAIGEATGLGAVLNTSFNEAGYPMVASPHDALLTFARTSMHALALDTHLITKREATLV
jgi:carbamoyltransferase